MNGHHVISGSLDETLRLWDGTSGQCVQICHGSRCGDFATVKQFPDGDELIAMSPAAFRSFYWNPMPGTLLDIRNYVAVSSLGVNAACFADEMRHRGSTP